MALTVNKKGLWKLWRDRFAYNLRNFRRVKGRWPDKEILAAARRGMEDAVRVGQRPPQIH